MDNHPLSGRSVGAGNAPPAAIRGRSFAGKVPGMPRPQPTRNAALAGRPGAGRARPLQAGTYPKNHTFSFVRSGR